MSGTMLFNTRPVSDSRARDYIRGLGSVLNVRGNTVREYTFAAEDEDPDATAIGNDWRTVGSDIHFVCTHARRDRA